MLAGLPMHPQSGRWPPITWSNCRIWLSGRQVASSSSTATPPAEENTERPESTCTSWAVKDSKPFGLGISQEVTLPVAAPPFIPGRRRRLCLDRWVARRELTLERLHSMSMSMSELTASVCLT